MMKYSALIVGWLREAGYTHCFFVAGGNIMHLLDAARTEMTCVPFVHEVAAALAAESFNELREQDGGRAFVMVTAGPGLTNALTGMAQAWLESRELLVIGGQVKSSDLRDDGLRQRGIQEVDGVALARPVCVVAERVREPVERATFLAWVERGRQPRKGPVFLEVCLDAQGVPIAEPERYTAPAASAPSMNGHRGTRTDAALTAQWTREARRPVLLLGGGVSRAAAERLRSFVQHASIAVATTWNGMDRVDSNDANYIGRPNTWGQRSANVLTQQADLVVAVGTRLGLQQTGFNWASFAPLARVVQVDIDRAELDKGHPRVDLAVEDDADAFLAAYLAQDLGVHDEWLAFCRHVRQALPLNDPENTTAPGYVDPYDFTERLGKQCRADDVIVPCSSGAGFTVPMQIFPQRFGQRISTAKGLASMGVGLSSAIGAALAFPRRRTILIEGDGGFTQNLQELATVDVNRLNLKIFVMSNEGYASIRMTQKNYFNGDYLGCDVRSGLGFPRWQSLFDAYGIPMHAFSPGSFGDPSFAKLFDGPGPAAFVVAVDPAQTYFPKISSRITADGGMESQPLHLMTPDLPPDVAADVLRYLQPSVSTVG